MEFGYLCISVFVAKTRLAGPSGGIGRRDGLKIHYPLKMCRFESGPGHFSFRHNADSRRVAKRQSAFHYLYSVEDIVADQQVAVQVGKVHGR